MSLNGANQDTASFTAPAVTSDALLRFNLTVSDAGGLTDTAEVTITVRAPATQSQSSGGGPMSAWLLGLLGLLALRRRLTRTGGT